MSAVRAFFRGDTDNRPYRDFFVRWLLHVCNRPFAQLAIEHGAPCVSLCPQQGLTLVGLLALAFAFGGFFVFGTVLRVLVLALALAVFLAFVLAFVFGL